MITKNKNWKILLALAKSSFGKISVQKPILNYVKINYLIMVKYEHLQLTGNYGKNYRNILWELSYRM